MYILQYIHPHTHIYIKTNNHKDLSYTYHMKKRISFYHFKYLRCSHYKVKNNTIETKKMNFHEFIWLEPSLYEFGLFTKFLFKLSSLVNEPNWSQVYLSKTRVVYEHLDSFTALTITCQTYVKVNLFTKNLIFQPLKGWQKIKFADFKP